MVANIFSFSLLLLYHWRGIGFSLLTFTISRVIVFLDSQSLPVGAFQAGPTSFRHTSIHIGALLCFLAQDVSSHLGLCLPPIRNQLQTVRNSSWVGRNGSWWLSAFSVEREAIWLYELMSYVGCVHACSSEQVEYFPHLFNRTVCASETLRGKLTLV